MDVQVEAAINHDAVVGNWHDAPSGTLGGGGGGGGSAWDFGHLLSNPESERGGGRQDRGADHEAMAGAWSRSLTDSQPASAAYAPDSGAQSPHAMSHQLFASEPGAQLLDHDTAAPARQRDAGPDHYNIYDGAQASSQQAASQFGSPSEWGPSHLVSVSTGDGVRTEARELESEWQLEELLGHIDALEGLLCVLVSVCAEVVGAAAVGPGCVRSAYRCMSYHQVRAQLHCARAIHPLTEFYTQLSCATPRKG